MIENPKYIWFHVIAFGMLGICCCKPFGTIACGRFRILDFVAVRGNPRHFQCMLDEDLIRRATMLELVIFAHPKPTVFWGSRFPLTDSSGGIFDDV